MPTAFPIVAFSLLFVPVCLINDGNVIRAITAAYLALALAAGVSASRKDELKRQGGRLTWSLLAGIAPAVWMLIQILPLGLVGHAHAVWSSAASALDIPLSASISVDRGASLIAAGRYLGFVAVTTAVVFVAIDRRRAEWMLYAIVAAALSVALLLLASLISPRGLPFVVQNVTDAASILMIGCFASAAMGARARERDRSKASQTETLFFRRRIVAMTLPGVAFVLCLAAFLPIAASHNLVAAAMGLSLFGLLFLVRRFGFGLWGAALVVVAIASVAAAVFSQMRPPAGVSIFLASAQQPGLQLAARIEANTGWTGSGAGTFASLARLYHGVEEMEGLDSAPTFASAIAIELGWPALFVAVCGALSLLALLSKATILRGRDWFFSAAGAAAVMAFLVTAFADAGLLSSSVALMASAVVGLAVAQSAGRRA